MVSWVLLGIQAVQGIAAGMVLPALLARAAHGDWKACPARPGRTEVLVQSVYPGLQGERTVVWGHPVLWGVMV